MTHPGVPWKRPHWQQFCKRLERCQICDRAYKRKSVRADHFALQLVFVSLSANRGPRRHDGSASPYLSAPPRDKMPMMLLLAKPHFTALFALLEQLSNFDCSNQNYVSAFVCALTFVWEQPSLNVALDTAMCQQDSGTAPFVQSIFHVTEKGRSHVASEQVKEEIIVIRTNVSLSPGLAGGVQSADEGARVVAQGVGAAHAAANQP